MCGVMTEGTLMISLSVCVHMEQTQNRIMQIDINFHTSLRQEWKNNLHSNATDVVPSKTISGERWQIKTRRQKEKP